MEPLPLPPPLPPASLRSGPALKSTSLDRLDELHAYLRQCDNELHRRSYHKVRGGCPQALPRRACLLPAPNPPPARPPPHSSCCSC